MQVSGEQWVNPSGQVSHINHSSQIIAGARRDQNQAACMAEPWQLRADVSPIVHMPCAAFPQGFGNFAAKLLAWEAFSKQIVYCDNPRDIASLDSTAKLMTQYLFKQLDICLRKRLLVWNVYCKVICACLGNHYLQHCLWSASDCVKYACHECRGRSSYASLEQTISCLLMPMHLDDIIVS